MAGNESLQQPWTQWYKAKEIIAGTMNYVVPVMAAGNQAPASQKSGRLDLSNLKKFPKNSSDFQECKTLEQPWKEWYVANENRDGSVQFVVPIMAAGNQAPASKVNGRLDLSKQKAPEGGTDNTRR